MTIIAGIEQHSTNEKPRRKQIACVERVDMCFARINNQNNFYRYFLAHCRTANQKIEIKVGYMYKTFSNKEKNLYVGVVQCECVLRNTGRTGGGVRFGL